jgi:hypothetical protein
MKKVDVEISMTVRHSKRCITDRFIGAVPNNYFSLNTPTMIPIQPTMLPSDIVPEQLLTKVRTRRTANLREQLGR